SLQVTFAGPPAQRYLRLTADKAFTIWAHRLTVDPQQYPILALTWAVERFPSGAALDLPGRNDRAVAVVVSLGPTVRSGVCAPICPAAWLFSGGKPKHPGRPIPVFRPAPDTWGTPCNASIPTSSTSRCGRGERG